MNIGRARELLNAPATQNEPDAADGSHEDEASMLAYPCPCCGGRMIIIASDNEPATLAHPCPCCGGRMIIIETFERDCTPRRRPSVPIRIDTS